MKALRRVVSALLVLALFVAGGIGLSALTAGSIAAAPLPNPSLDALLNAGGAVIVWILFGYLALGAVLALLAALPGAAGLAFATISERVTPQAYRRVAQVALGLTVVAGPVLGTVSAQAAPSDTHLAAATASTGRLDLDRPGNTTTAPANRLDLDRPGATGGPAPGGSGGVNRPATNDPIVRPVRDHVDNGDAPGSQADSQADSQTRNRAGSAYTVQRGDCLWAIAATHLPARATDAEITTEWHRWYVANQHTIGTNPNLIYPGQTLHAPTD